MSTNREDLPEQKPCYLCDSREHAFCGLCADCKDHAAFTREPCDECGGCGEVALPRPAEGTKTCPSCKGEGWGEALSECCGASGHAYDNMPDYEED